MANIESLLKFAKAERLRMAKEVVRRINHRRKVLELLKSGVRIKFDQAR